MSFNRIALRRGAQWLLCAGALVTELIAASQNNIKGTVVGQELGQPKTTLPGVSVQAFEAAGTEVASRHTDNNGAFTFGLDPKSRVYRLILWDERNRWWGREIADLGTGRDRMANDGSKGPTEHWFQQPIE